MDFLEGLNPRPREAVQHGEGPLLVLAGAGSGKTRVITHRIAHLMSVHRVPGWAILAVTFTNKAAAEMRERVRSLTGGIGGDGPTLATFHSFCVRLLRREGAPLAAIRPGFTTSFTIYDDDDQLSILKQVYRQLGLDEKFMAYRAALSRISHAKSHKQSPEEMARAASDPATTRLAVVYEKYEAKLRESNALDFDDLLLEAVRLLQQDAAAREKLNRRYEFVMVDEYQDTNRSQYELMRLLAGSGAIFSWWATRTSRFTAGAAPISAIFWTSSAIFPAPPSSGWSRITAPAGTSWRPPTPWWPTTPSASANRCGPKPAAAKKSCSTKRRMRKTRRCSSPTPSRTGWPRIPRIAWRCSIAPTPNRGRSRRRCGDTGGNTQWSADSAFTSAPKLKIFSRI